MPKEESKEEEKKAELATIRGAVIGYLKDVRTRPITPASAFLFIVVGEGEAAKMYYPAPEKDLGKLKKKFMLYGVEALAEEHPEVYRQVHYELESFSPFKIEPDNTLAIFEFRRIPIGDWKYIVAAYVEETVYVHTEKMGDNGLGKNELILGKDLLEQPEHVLENVVVPVPDKWFAKLKKAPEIKVKETDKDMEDPRHVRDLRAKEI
ncbi:hypothetical protein KY359_06155 [Candidatus Woesearchaeota archaeon]|nr:hypothetical protein [Candidatus Woesearchaeota archaeon]